MREIFKQLFKKYNFSDKQVEELAVSFSLVAILKLLEVTENRFSDEEKLTIKGLMQNQKDNLKQIDQLILSKYSPEEFDKIMETHILPLFEDYRKKVIV